MIKKFSKSKILALVTTGAIVVSTAFSFAAWNKLADKATGTVTMDKQVTVEATGFAAGDVVKTPGANAEDAATYQGDVKFNVANADANKTKLTLVADVMDGANSVKDNFDVAIIKGSTPLTGGADESITVGENTYHVSITPKQGLSVAESAALAGKDITVEVTGTLSEKTAN